MTDAYGGFGGISRYNRDLLSALAALPEISSVTVLPRVTDAIQEDLPDKIVQLPAVWSRVHFSLAALRLGRTMPKGTVVLCGHLLMAPIARLVSKFYGMPLWLQVHGVDAWDRPSWLVRRSCETATLVTAVSRYTRREMLRNWWGGDRFAIRVLPNTVGTKFVTGQKNAALIERHQLQGKKIILTVSRISRADYYKGHSQVIAAMKYLAADLPDAVYLIVGDGDNLSQLKHDAKSEGVSDRVIFAGRASESELLSYFQTADVFIMPSTKEGFGIVFLEAAACGIPVIAGNRDGSVDALAEGAIGTLVDPHDPAAIAAALRQCLEHGADPATLLAVRRFSQDNFRKHVRGLVEELNSVLKSPQARPRMEQ